MDLFYWCTKIILLHMCIIGSMCAGMVHKRVCYFTSWSRYRPGAARYTAANVDPFLCTHLIYAFAEFDPQGNMMPFSNDLTELQVYRDFNALKQRNPSLKTLVAVGGWTFGSKPFSQMAGDPATRTNFVSSAVRFLRQHGFDGLDLDWEYPGLRGGAAKDRDNFVALCKELRQAFDAEATGSKRLILTAAVPASRRNMDIGYNIPMLDRYLDIWNLMTYDYHGAWEGVTGHNSPLLPSTRETADGLTENVQWTANEYVRRGASKHKVVIGLPMYGRAFRLENSAQNTPRSPATLGPGGPITREAGFWAYHEVCKDIANSGSGQVILDGEQRVPYYIKNDVWISFDDVDSIKEKTRWLKRNGFGGYMAWALDMDVFNPTLCDTVNTPHPLLSSATAVLLDPTEQGAPDVPNTTTPAPVTTIVPTRQTTTMSFTTTTRMPWRVTTKAPSAVGAGLRTTTRAPFSSTRGPGSTPSTTTVHSGATEFSCADKPYKGYSDPTSPCRFIVCWAGNAHHMTCQSGTVFDESLGVCVWMPENSDITC